MRLISLHMTCTHQTNSFISSLCHLRSTWTNKQLHNSNFKLVEEEEKNNRQNVIKTIVKLSRTKEEDKEVSSQKSEEFFLERKSIGLKDFKHFIFLLLSQHVCKFKGHKLYFVFIICKIPWNIYWICNYHDLSVKAVKVFLNFENNN